MDPTNFYGQCTVQRPVSPSLIETSSSSDTDDDDFTLSSEDEQLESDNDDEQAHAERSNTTENQPSGEGNSDYAQEIWLPVSVSTRQFTFTGQET